MMVRVLTCMVSSYIQTIIPRRTRHINTQYKHAHQQSFLYYQLPSTPQKNQNPFRRAGTLSYSHLVVQDHFVGFSYSEPTAKE